MWLVAADAPSRTTGRFWLDRRPRSTHYLPGTRETEEQRDRLVAVVDGALAPYRSGG